MIPALFLAALACPPETSLPETVARIEASGGVMVDFVPVRGVGFDHLLIAEFGGAIVAGPFKDGCSIAPPYPFGPALQRAGA